MPDIGNSSAVQIQMQQTFDASGEVSKEGRKILAQSVKPKSIGPSTQVKEERYDPAHIEKYIRDPLNQVLRVSLWKGKAYDEDLVRKWFDSDDWGTSSGHFNHIAPWWKKGGRTVEELLSVFREIKDEHIKYWFRELGESLDMELKYFKEELMEFELPYNVRSSEKPFFQWIREEQARITGGVDAEEFEIYRALLGAPARTSEPFLTWTPNKARLWALAQVFLDEEKRHKDLVDRIHLLIKNPEHYVAEDDKSKQRKKRKARVKVGASSSMEASTQS
jgi:hypothetical protein